MILTNCAACAAPLPRLAKQCSRCKTRYCGAIVGLRATSSRRARGVGSGGVRARRVGPAAAAATASRSVPRVVPHVAAVGISKIDFLGDRRGYAALFASAPVARVQRRQSVSATTPQRAVLLLSKPRNRDRCREVNPNPIYQSGNKASESRPRGLLETARAGLLVFPASR